MGSQSNSLGVDPSVRRVLDSLRCIVRELRLASHSCEKRFGLSAAQFFVLQVLGDEPGLSLGDLATRTATDQSSASVVVRKLEEKGLLAKYVSGVDGRRLELRLTPKGRRLVKDAPPPIQAQLIKRVETLSATDRKALGDLLDRCALREEEGAPMFFEEPTTLNRRKSRRG